MDEMWDPLEPSLIKCKFVWLIARRHTSALAILSLSLLSVHLDIDLKL